MPDAEHADFEDDPTLNLSCIKPEQDVGGPVWILEKTTRIGKRLLKRSIRFYEGDEPPEVPPNVEVLHRNDSAAFDNAEQGLRWLRAARHDWVGWRRWQGEGGDWFTPSELHSWAVRVSSNPGRDWWSDEGHVA